VKSFSPTTSNSKAEQVPGATPPSTARSFSSWLRRLVSQLKYPLLALTCVALSAFATIAAIEILFPVRLPTAMVGKWVVVEGEGLKGATLEFFADGSMIGTVQNPGKQTVIKGRVRVEGNFFRVTTTSHAAGSEVTDREEILDLTEHRFVVQDAHGEVLIMERLLPAGASKAGGAK
jgi:uncharacterized protein (TIGR03066 family)